MDFEILTGRLYRYFNLWGVWILMAAFIAYVFMTQRKEVKVVRPAVIVIEDGKFKRVVYNSGDPVNKIVLIDIAEKMGRVMWEYTGGDKAAYAQKFVDFKPYLNDTAGSKIKAAVENNLRNSAVNESSSFVLDREKSRAVREKEQWYLVTEGIRTISSGSGTRTEIKKIDMKFEDGGGEDALYRISDFTLRSM